MVYYLSFILHYDYFSQGIHVLEMQPNNFASDQKTFSEIHEFHKPRNEKSAPSFLLPCEVTSMIERYLHLPDRNPPDIMQHSEMLHSLVQIGASIPSVKNLLPIFNQVLIVMSLQHIPLPSASKAPTNSVGIVEQGLLFDFPLNIPFTSCNGSKDGDSPMLLMPKCPQAINEYTIIEPLKKDVVIQAIQEYMQTRPYLQLYHHKLSNSLVVLLHTGCNSGDVHSYNWREYSHSKVGFNTYLQYVAKCVSSSVSLALEKEEEDSLVKEQSVEPLKDEVDVREEHSVNEQVMVVNDMPTANTSNGKMGFVIDNTSMWNKPNPPCVRNGSKVDSTAKESDSEDVLFDAQKKLFYGYDIGDQAVLVEGSVSTVCTSDGSQIIYKKTGFVKNFDTHQLLLIDDSVTISSVFLQAPSSDVLNREIKNAGGTAAVSKENQLLSVLPQPPTKVMFASVHVSLPKDGINIVASKFGPQGNGMVPNKPKSVDQLSKLEYQEAQIEKDSRPQSRQGSSPQPKLTKKQQEQQQLLLEQQRRLEEKRIQQRKEIESKLQIEIDTIAKLLGSPLLSLTTKDGLQIVCSKMSTKSSFAPSNTVITQKFVSLEFSNPVSLQVKELSRVYFPDGSVLCKYSNSTSTIMCADGSMFETWSEPIIQRNFDKSLGSKQSSAEIHTASLVVNEVDGLPADGSETKSHSHVLSSNIWLATTPNGCKYLTREDAIPLPFQQSTTKDTEHFYGSPCNIPHSTTKTPMKNVNLYSATDPISQEVSVHVLQINSFGCI